MAKGFPKNGINKGWFKKGGVSPRRGVKCSAESIEKMRRAKLGRKVIFSDEHRKNLSKALLGKPNPWSKGKKRPWTEEWKNNIRIAMKLRWADRTKLKKREDRKSRSYTDWLEAVRSRDGRQCRMENTDCFGILEAHHILPWRSHPELRYDINNGILLCKFHHPRKRVEESKMAHYFHQLISSTI